MSRSSRLHFCACVLQMVYLVPARLDYVNGCLRLNIPALSIIRKSTSQHLTAPVACLDSILALFRFFNFF